MQVLLQSMWDIVQFLTIIGGIGSAASFILTLYFLLKTGISSTAWLYALAATGAFVYAGFGIAIVYFNVGSPSISISWSSVIGIIGGYILIGIAFSQYLRDKDRKESIEWHSQKDAFVN